MQDPDPWVRKIPWSRKWQPTLVLLPGKFHGQRSLVGYSPRGHKESDTAEHDRKYAIIHHSVQFSSATQSCPTLCNPMNRSTPGLPVHHQLPSSLKLMSIESVMPSSHLILCRPLLLLPPIPPSIRVFSNESTLHMRWPKYWSFSFSIPKNTQDWSPLGWTGWIYLQSKGLSRVFSNTTVQKQQFFSAQLSSQSDSHIYTWPLEKL